MFKNLLAEEMPKHRGTFQFKKSMTLYLLIFVVASALLVKIISTYRQESSSEDNNISENLERIEHRILELKNISVNVTNKTQELSGNLDNLSKQSKNESDYGHFVPPPHDNIAIKTKLFNKVKEVQDNITKLYSDLNDKFGDVNDIKERTATVERGIENIVKDIDKEKRHTVESFGQYERLISDLTSSYKKIVNDMTKRLHDMEQKEKESLIPQLIDAIKNKNYYTADNLLNRITDEQVKSIVDEVCKSDPCKSLYVFSTKVGGVKKFLIYKELVELVVKKNKDSYCDYMKLIYLIQNAKVLSNAYESDIQARSVELIDRLVEGYKSVLRQRYVSLRTEGVYINGNLIRVTLLPHRWMKIWQKDDMFIADLNYHVNFDGKDFTCSEESTSIKNKY